MKNHPKRVFGPFAFAMLALAGCTTPVDVDLPEAPVQGVMEASIRLGEPPLVFLTTTQGYFDAVDASALASLYVDDAEVVMAVNGEEVPLLKVCSADLPPESLAEAAMFLGVPVKHAGRGQSVCLHRAWIALDLRRGGHGVRAWRPNGMKTACPIVLRSTQMPAMPQLDSIWFEIPETSTNDSLGLIWTAFTDPEGFGDAYRWASKREGKDPDFIIPWAVSLTMRLSMDGRFLL